MRRTLTVTLALSVLACGSETTSPAAGGSGEDSDIPVGFVADTAGPDVGVDVPQAVGAEVADPVDPGQCVDLDHCVPSDGSSNGVCYQGVCHGCDDSLDARKAAVKAAYGDQPAGQNLWRCVTMKPRPPADSEAASCAPAAVPRTLALDEQNACVQWACEEAADAPLGISYVEQDVLCPANSPCTTYACDPATGCGVAEQKTAGTRCDTFSADTCAPSYCDAGGECKGTLPGARIVKCVRQICHPTKGEWVLDPEKPYLEPGTGCKIEGLEAGCYTSAVCTQAPGATEVTCQGSIWNLPGGEPECPPCQKEKCEPTTGVATCEADIDATGSQCYAFGNCAGLCNGGACEKVSPTCCGKDADCDDQKKCTQKSCDVANAVCVFTPFVPDTTDPCIQKICTEASGAENLPTTAPCEDGDKCTTGDTCADFKCVPGAPLECKDGLPCTDDSCIKLTGCSNPPTAGVPQACDDSDSCTTDTCGADGQCKHVPVPCKEDDDPCTAAICVDGGCTTTVQSGQCDDDDACTKADKCVGGSCVGTSVECPDDGSACTNETCNPSTGTCSTSNASDGTGCNDGRSCTFGEVCVAGQCRGAEGSGCGTAPLCFVNTCQEGGGCGSSETVGKACSDGDVCTTGDACVAGLGCRGGILPCDDQDQCTEDSCDPISGCAHAERVGPCDDGKPCTTDDACTLAGTCVGVLRACNDGNVCTIDSCDPAIGVCSYIPRTGECDDGNACTEGGVCQGTTCSPGATVNCDKGNACMDYQCLPATGCRETPKIVGTSCSDGDSCTDSDRCNNGSCAGTPRDCGPGLACHTTPACSGGACKSSPLPDNTSCSDGSDCTSGDKCSGGTCSGTSKVCALGTCMTDNTCSEATGNCAPVLAPAGTPCDDGTKCTSGDVCQGSTCKPGAALSCDDQNPCTDDSCDPIGGCANVANSAPCNDGNGCTGEDVCDGKVCVGKQPVVCTAGQCQVSSTCNTATGSCVPVPKVDGLGCTDNSECTVGDACTGGACVPGPTKQCDDGKTCTTDNCVGSVPGGCVFSNRTGECEDGNSCTVGDTCVAGGCAPGAPNTACCLSDADCDAKDSNKCDGTLMCVGNQCVARPNSAVTCDSSANGACKTNQCVAATGVCVLSPTNEGGACEDGSKCTLQDTCQGGTCKAGAAVTCTAASDCHLIGTCDPGTGTCSTPTKPLGAACEDGNLCTLNDACNAGVCAPGALRGCPVKGVCYLVGTCNPATGVCSEPQQPNGTSCDDGVACTGGAACQAGQCVGGKGCGFLGMTCGAGQCFAAGTASLNTAWLGDVLAGASGRLRLGAAWAVAAWSSASGAIRSVVLGGLAGAP